MAKKSKELYQRNDSAIWWYRFTSPLTSRQIRVSTKSENKQLAQQMLDEAKAKARLEAEQKNNPTTVKRYCIEATIKWYEIN